MILKLIKGRKDDPQLINWWGEHRQGFVIFKELKILLQYYTLNYDDQKDKY